MGVSHQKIGRWLREGEPSIIDPYTGLTVRGAGAKKIPESAHALIDNAFEYHKSLSKQIAKSHKTPYLSGTPVFQFRKPLRTGEPGQRSFVLHTQYIRQHLRTQIFAGMKRTNKIHTASVRSTVDFVKYTGRIVDQKIKAGRKSGTRKQMIADLVTTFKSRFEGQSRDVVNNIIAVENIKQTLFTPRTDFQSYITTDEAINDIENKLDQRHSKSATQFADEYIFHIIPQNYVQPKPRTKQTRTSLKRR